MDLVLLSASAVLLLGGCPVTAANGRVPPDFPANARSHGNGRIWTILPPDGRLVAERSEVRRDGSIHRKFPWWSSRASGRRLRVTGRRIDGPSPRLRASVHRTMTPPDVPHMFPSTLLFPRQGCWRVRARTRRSSLRFVISVTAGENGGR